MRQFVQHTTHRARRRGGTQQVAVRHPLCLPALMRNWVGWEFGISKPLYIERINNAVT